MTFKERLEKSLKENKDQPKLEDLERMAKLQEAAKEYLNSHAAGGSLNKETDAPHSAPLPTNHQARS